MLDSNLVSALISAVRSTAQIPPQVVIRAESRLVEDLGIDSLDLVGVYLKVQDEFGVVIDENDMPALSRISDLAAYITEHQPAEAA